MESDENVSADDSFETDKDEDYVCESEDQMPSTSEPMKNNISLSEDIIHTVEQKKQNSLELITVARKKKYNERHSPQNLNPSKMTELKLLEGITNKTLYPGPLPSGSNCKSANWDNGMQYVYFTDTNMPVINWFICSICGWTTNRSI